ncbi:MAG TPA: ArgE/DapE family deacylase [Jiangellaceae bacterium]
MALTAVEQSVVDAVDPDAILGDLAALVSIPSVGGSAGEIAVQQWCAQRLAELGASVDHWKIDLDELRSTDDYPGEEVDRDEAYGCVGVFGDNTERPGLILSGHTDVVPPGDPARWTHHPWRLSRENDVLYGRGAADMKAGVAAVVGALGALRAQQVTLRRPLAVHAVIGEEDGGVGAYATVRRGHLGAACVIAEPTDASTILANAGSLTFRIEVPGRAAHGSSRLEGHSALDAALPVLTALSDLETRRNRDVDPVLGHLDLPYPVSVGIVRAGDWASTVPDVLIAEGRYGVRLDEPVERARAEFEAAVADACAADPWLSAHPARVIWPGGVFASGRLPAGHHLLADASRAALDTEGWEPAARGAPYGSDLRQYAAAGVPTILLGPGSVASAHTVDESVSLGEIVAFARVYAVLALRLCG